MDEQPTLALSHLVIDNVETRTVAGLPYRAVTITGHGAFPGGAPVEVVINLAEPQLRALAGNFLHLAAEAWETDRVMCANEISLPDYDEATQ